MKRKLITTLLLTTAMAFSTVSPIYATEMNVAVEANAETEEAAAEETVVGEGEGEEEKIPLIPYETVEYYFKADNDYTGEEIKVPITLWDVQNDYVELVEGVDYTVEYRNNIEPGIEAELIVTGIGRFEGTMKFNFNIYGPKNPIINEDTYYISQEWSSEEYKVFPFTNKPITPWVDVYSSEDGRMLEREHYTVTYENNVEIGTATIIVEGVGDFSGTITDTFEIVENPNYKEKVLNEETTTVKTVNPSYEYTGMVRKPNPIVTFNDGTESKKLVKDVDYTVSYENNKEVGTATVIVTGIGEYSGSASATFELTPVDLKAKGATAKTVKASYPCTGKERKPVPVVKCKVGNKTVTLENGKDFTVSYKNNKNAGTATVTVKGIGNFKGTITTTFKLYNVYELNSTNTTVKTKSASYEYTGMVRKPAPIVTFNDGKTTKTLVKDTDYTVSYENNKEVGTATVTVTGIGNYKGTVSSTFKLTPIDLKAKGATAKTIRASYPCTGKVRKPIPVVKCKVGNKVISLENGKDFTVSYKNNKDAGTATVTVKGIGNFK